VGASLSRIAVLSDVVTQQAQTTLPDAMPALAAIGENARAVIDDMSDAVWFIDPRLDSLAQVVARVRALASELFEGQHIRSTIDAPADIPHVPLASEQRRHIYLMLKEILTNVVRHARATRVTVRFTVSGAGIRFEVSDDGVGLNEYEADQAQGGLGGRGLQNLHQRAAALGGTVRFSSNGPHGGTTVIVDVPRPTPHVRAVGSVSARR